MMDTHQNTEPNPLGKPSVSLIIPTLNEAKNLPLVLPYIPEGVVDEVILVDGHSTDHTIRIAQRLYPSIRILLEPQHGKGAALSRGYQAANGDILVVIDADGSHDPREIPRMVHVLMEGADFVKGSRFIPPGGTTDMPRLRKWGNGLFVDLVNLLFSQHFTDLCYGFHAFWRFCLEELDLTKVEGFEVDTAIYLQAVRHQLKIVDVPSFEGSRFYGIGKLQTFPDGWRVLRTIFREWMTAAQQPAQGSHLGFRNLRRLAIADMQTPIPISGRTAQPGSTAESLAEKLNAHSWRTIEEAFDYLLLNQRTVEQEWVFPHVLIQMSEALGASSGSLLVLGENLRIIEGYVIFGRRVEHVQESRFLEMVEHGMVRSAVQSRKPVLIRNTRSDPRWICQPWEQTEGVSRSALIYPVFLENSIAGVLTFTRPIERSFEEEDIERLRAISIFY